MTIDSCELRPQLDFGQVVYVVMNHFVLEVSYPTMRKISNHRKTKIHHKNEWYYVQIDFLKILAKGWGDGSVVKSTA